MMRFITERALSRPEVLRWHKRIRERYTPPEDIKLTVLLPCSAKKPYSKSKSHMLFKRYIKRGAKNKISRVHEVSLTSPLGLVPRELENVYPAAHYDIPVTGHWTEEEKSIVAELLTNYTDKTNAKIIAHVDGPYLEICDELGIPSTGGEIYSETSLKNLEQRISETLKDCQPSKIDRKLERIKKICDFQFGLGASKYFEKVHVRGNAIYFKEKRAATINPATGFLALTLLGGELLHRYGKYLVEISFQPKTDSIFSIGVDRADHQIRPNDEVIVLFENEVVGVGRAILNGEEMEKSARGLAIKLRHRK